MIIETFDSKQTYELGYKLGCEAKAGDIYLSLIHISEPTRH